VTNMTRVPLAAVLFLVVLRIAIGWQFLYEGQWKSSTLSTAKPWTSEGFLKNAQGPFRDHFREMTGDPDDLSWLNEAAVNARWDAWQKRFVAHYELDKKQQDQLNILLNGKELYWSDPNKEPLPELPPQVVEFMKDEKNQKRYLTGIVYNADKKRLEVDGKEHLTPKEKAKLMSLTPVVEYNPLDPTDPKFGPEKDREGNIVKPVTDLEVAFCVALDKVYQRQAKLGFRERLKGTIEGTPDIAGDQYKIPGKNEYERLPGSAEQYNHLLARYEELHKDAKLAFNWTHLDFEKTKLMEQKAKATGPVKALDKELREAALKLVTLKQLAKGPVKGDPSPVRDKDNIVMAGLLILGFCLISGLFSRLSALVGAVMVFSFYLVWPPWPGVPEAPGPEHSFIVNKNLIEVFALLALASLPTGKWFGIDAAISACLKRRKAKAQAAKA